MNTYMITFEDPLNDMISSIQELTFRTAIATTFTAPSYSFMGASIDDQPKLTDTQDYISYPNLTTVNRTLSQSVSARLFHQETVYQSHYGWLAGAMAVIGITFFALLPIFEGWWHLGRKVSMSPIEIAKAFDAPLLRGTDDNGVAREILAETGHKPIRYGASFKGSSTLGESSSYGGAQMMKDDDSIRSGISKRRLHIGAEGTLEAPREGETFGQRQGDVESLFHQDTLETVQGGPIKYDG